MTVRFALAVFACFLAAAAPVQAQDAPAAPETPSAPAAPHVFATVNVTLTTSAGPITVAVETERAPVSAANFLRYVDQRRFDGVSFYRAVPIGTGYGLIQGGVRNAPRRVLPPIAHEPTSQTGLSHVDGAISWARGAPGTASGDFFITIGALTSLDAQPPAEGTDTGGFAVFGRVIEGMDVVRAILAMPTDPNAGDGSMRGQMLAAPVQIVTARRALAMPPPP